MQNWITGWSICSFEGKKCKDREKIVTDLLHRFQKSTEEWISSKQTNKIHTQTNKKQIKEQQQNIAELWVVHVLTSVTQGGHWQHISDTKFEGHYKGDELKYEQEHNNMKRITAQKCISAETAKANS